MSKMSPATDGHSVRLSVSLKPRVTRGFIFLVSSIPYFLQILHRQVSLKHSDICHQPSTVVIYHQSFTIELTTAVPVSKSGRTGHPVGGQSRPL
jgi:hypothetical protein